MDRRTRFTIGILITLVIATAALALLFGDFLGARLIKKGSPRLNVQQGEKVTLELSPSNSVRKLEICTEKKNFILGYSDFTDCRPLHYSVAAGVTKADVTIPATFPLERAVVITRTRAADGRLVPAAPTDEKITLWVVAKKLASRSEPASNSSQESSGSNGGSSGSSGGTNDLGTTQQLATIEANLQEVCVDPSDFEVGVRWSPPSISNIRFRLAGQSSWQHPCMVGGCNYTDSANSRQALIFSGGNGQNNPLPFSTDFEFQFYASANHPDGSNVEPSEIFRFNSGAAPGQNDYAKSRCDFRQLHP